MSFEASVSQWTISTAFRSFKSWRIFQRTPCRRLLLASPLHMRPATCLPMPAIQVVFDPSFTLAAPAVAVIARVCHPLAAQYTFPHRPHQDYERATLRTRILTRSSCLCKAALNHVRTSTHDAPLALPLATPIWCTERRCHLDRKPDNNQLQLYRARSSQPFNPPPREDTSCTR